MFCSYWHKKAVFTSERARQEDRNMSLRVHGKKLKTKLFEVNDQYLIDVQIVLLCDRMCVYPKVNATTAT